MNLLIDTNVLLDVLKKREPFCGSSLMILKLCEAGHCKGYISALSVADIVYILRKNLDPVKTARLTETISRILSVLDLTGSDLLNASGCYWNDFEDALQYAAARRAGADYIITRNIADYKASGIPPLTPDEYLDRYN